MSDNQLVEVTPEREPQRTALAYPMIHPAIVAIMRSIGHIAKDQKNTAQNYNFRGVDQVYNAVHPHFAAHGVYSTSEVLSAEHRELTSSTGKPYMLAIIKMRFTFWAEDGSHVSTEVVGEGMDYGGDKASNKAMSVADKYAILQLLKIPTACVDPDRHDNPTADASAPKAQPRSQRVTKEQVGRLATEWQNTSECTVSADAPKDQMQDAFKAWCKLTVFRDDWNPGRIDEWTTAFYELCAKKVGMLT